MESIPGLHRRLKIRAQVAENLLLNLKQRADKNFHTDGGEIVSGRSGKSDVLAMTNKEKISQKKRTKLHLENIRKKVQRT